MNENFENLVKKEFHHLDTIYFNTAYFGPSPYSAKQKVSRALQKELDPSFYEYNTWMGVSERMRGLMASMLGTSPDHICHATSTSDVINIIANGFPFKPGDRVAAMNKDYPSNVLPWMLAQKRGRCTFDLLNLGSKEIVPTAKWLSENIHPDTKIFNISHVAFDTGKRMNLVEIGKFCRQRDILFVVDATQSLGGIPITQEERKYIDVIACSSYKWLLGPYGHAFAYFNERAIDEIKHQSANWILSPKSKNVNSLLDYTIETLHGARKFDRGQASNMLAMSCLEAGLEFFNEIDLGTIAEHNSIIRDYFLENYPQSKFELITPRDHMANIIALKSKGIDPLELERELKYHNVDVSVREGNIRLSFHLFNSKEQVETLLKAIDI